MSNQVILVDDMNQELGLYDKIEAHRSGLLHRAFSIFIFRKNRNGNFELLLQQRALSKYHTPGLWSNTCCSHGKWDVNFVLLDMEAFLRI
jgi:isopentenyl-diphosphate Delta-isomerase